ncbi:hypothetical protein OBV_38580 [Oscillibacter valericigenes Sjm18-20]|nr:hypothetical protein OBV_38580 [Oscillibacter valericigenes Sjm18-20]
MGLFDKKHCDICGEKISLLGNRKLEDGNLCKDCAKLLSPFMTDRRRSTVEDIKAHLQYREDNKEKVTAFNPTKVIGDKTRIYLDEDKQQWLISSQHDWRDENPDVMDFSQVTGSSLDIDESKWQIYRKLPDGKQASYDPPRYEFKYTFNMIILVNSPWFSEIKFRVNDNRIDNRNSVEYREAQRNASEIRNALEQMREGVREAVASASMPKTAIKCPHCNATTIPDENGCCEYCGGAITTA